MEGSFLDEGAGNPIIQGISFELIPIKNLEQQLPLLPAGSRVSVTCSPAKGVDVTMALAARLRGLGLRATPPTTRRRPPRLDEHGDEIRAWLDGSGSEQA